jgi:ABC-type glutathione transport system ATPase component
MVFQDPYSSLDPRQTVGACLAEVLRFHTAAGKASRRDRTLKLLHQVGLDERHEVSGRGRCRAASVSESRSREHSPARERQLSGVVGSV